MCFSLYLSGCPGLHSVKRLALNPPALPLRAGIIAVGPHVRSILFAIKTKKNQLYPNMDEP